MFDAIFSKRLTIAQMLNLFTFVVWSSFLETMTSKSSFAIDTRTNETETRHFPMNDKFNGKGSELIGCQLCNIGEHSIELLVNESKSNRTACSMFASEKMAKIVS